MEEINRDVMLARCLAKKVSECGGKTYFVGGCVRDELMRCDFKDYDIEVHGISVACLEEILDSLGERIAIGESFGIYNLKGYTVDIAMPRKEKVKGTGHKDFDVFVDPFIGTKDAAKRRDFTFNALMKDVISGEIVDHYNGLSDLKSKTLRHVNSESFPEDPLRVLRGAQFAARFGADVAEETIELCKNMELSNLSKERIEGEIKKALLKAEKPSVFFETLRKMNQLDFWFPELSALCDVPQNPKHHAEGDVWVHTMMVIDAAAKYRNRAENPFGFMLGAVCHDFGKAITTENIGGVIHAYEHERKGLPIAETFLKRITNENKLIDYVLNLVELHMQPNIAGAAVSAVKSTNKMFDRACDPQALIYLAIADGEGSVSEGGYVSHEKFLLERLGIFRKCMARPYVMGRDLVLAGIVPGEDFSDILSYAHKLRLAGIDKDNAMKQVLAYARTIRKQHK